MLTVGKKIILVGRFDEGDGYYATEALCRHMRWPLAYGGKVKDDCITCPLPVSYTHLTLPTKA